MILWDFCLYYSIPNKTLMNKYARGTKDMLPK